MVHIICYLAAVGLNLMWLLLGDHLHLAHQLAVPLLTVLIAGAGVLVRLHGLPHSARQRYLRGALWALFLYYLALMLTAGGQVYNEEGNNIGFHDESGTKPLQLWLDMIEDGSL